ncbi:toxic anion resistance protein [Shouchella clausii]|uniref:Tellurite resistance protein n=1 Tax=Shouchella clausii (strain KSM-K16) TaxID=66692 RepID=Q5WGD4_SHOC1|nr:MULTISPECIES: toxic anion resistance protein [Shouchella]ALA55156.1 Tellurite resistance protein [Shouchella clausii]MBU3231579.1 toxic anion resistance protein [Shouchella clausii]MBU3265137.1 toxic anion resistance protein [Shouchella clausii]MBU3509272.1 toxic anion resistance protein [Shouchella clausii]MBU3533684.1 toxic anion resistance protein [Shouchella clausii]
MTEQNNAQDNEIDVYKNETDIHTLLQKLDSLGETEQKQAGESLEALKRPVKQMMNDEANTLPKQLHELREVVGQLEPDYLHDSSFKKFLNKLLKKDPIEQYAKKYQTVEAQVDHIIEGLLTGKDKLQEDNVMLQELKVVAKERIENLNNQIAVGTELHEMLEQEMTSERWADNSNELKKGQVKVTTRIKNMQQAVMVLQQSLASVDLIMENNEKLEEAIFNAITMTKNIITVTASIQLALTNQKKVITAVQNVNQATESMLLSNAELLKQNTEETLKTLEEPAIALDAFRKAYDNVFKAIELTEQSNERIVTSGKQFIKEMDQLNSEMQTKLLNR